VLVRPSQGSHERHGGGGVDAEEAHGDRGVDGLLMSCGGGRGKMLIRKWRERISSEVAEG
jgi:hypothetical protein